ncbi:MAG: hypothetical protein OXG23_10120 [Chloroflexi bacterium]|nr:hypothetical protein [Chloroflexota bacterium]
MASALEYVILGHDNDEQGTKRRKLLMFNGVLPSLDPTFYLQLVDLAPMPDGVGGAGPALVLVDHDRDRMLLATIQPATEDPQTYTDHYVFIPADALAESALQLERWLAFLPEVSPDINRTLPLLQPPDFNSIKIETRAANLQRILDELPADGFDYMLTLLGALLHERPLVIANFPPDFQERLALVSGIQALIPGRLAARMTFASHAPAHSLHPPQLTFVDEDEDVSGWTFDWSAPTIASDVLEHPYIEALRALWQGDPAELAAEIQPLARLADANPEQGKLGQELAQIADRFWLDRHVQAPEDVVSTEAIIRILDGAKPPRDETRRQYIRKLLQNALSERDWSAGARVAEELENDADLESKLSDIFDAMLEDQPDSVYVFIRNRLMHLGIDEQWIPRLQTAAKNSLEVAIEEGDIGTLAGWLELIAHEPQAYLLHDILQEAILLAKQRAYGDGELGIHLILIAVRRVPEIVDALYEDEQLIDALDADVRIALQTPTADSLQRLTDERAEYFLLALYHGVKVSDDVLVTLATIERLWSLYRSDQRVNLPAVYRPPAVARLLATEASHQMTEEAVDYLFESIIAGDDRKLTTDMAHHLANSDLLFPRLSQTLSRDTLPMDKVLSIMHAVSNIKSAPPHEVIDTYFTLLDYYQWEPQTQRLMEALSRLMAKHHEAQVSYRHLWRLFDSCHALEIESATRVSMTHLLLQYGEEEDLPTIVDGVARICGQIGWSKPLGAAVNTWWRNYTHSLSLTQLQRLERELAPQRHLEAQKHILYSVVAVRRWLHSQDPVELANSISTTFTILEHFADAFDAEHIHEIDSHTIRRELDEIGRGLSSEKRHILANNLRNLAHRVTQMAEKRSKPSLIRSDESIERQLQHGEADPQGSIDMMKWIAGYLDGAHAENED